MRVSNAEKQKTRDRILTAAAQQFREKGLEQVGVAEVMQSAGLTHGGFYRHFASKDDLAAAAATHAFAQFLTDGSTGAAVTPEQFTDRYLSLAHARNPGLGCPVASLGPEIARADAPLRAAFAKDLDKVIDLLAGGQAARRPAATADLAAMIGTMILARLMDDEKAQRLIEDARASRGLSPSAP